jgi:hypothetical protein
VSRVFTPTAASCSGCSRLSKVISRVLSTGFHRLVGQTRERGVKLAGEGGLLAALTKRLLDSALAGETTDHLGYEKHDAAGATLALGLPAGRSGQLWLEVGRAGAMSYWPARTRTSARWVSSSWWASQPSGNFAFTLRWTGSVEG